MVNKMIKNCLIIFMLFICSNAFCQSRMNVNLPKPSVPSINLPAKNILTISTSTLVITPKLIWQKEFEMPISSLQISSDGAKILLTTKPAFKEVKDAQYEHHTKREYSGESKLYYLDNKGNILWKYEHKISTGTYGLDAKMSDDGKYIACRVSEWATGSWENSDVKIQAWAPREILFFNSNNELLWSYNKNKFGWFEEISLDGKLLTTIYKYENEYPTIFDKKGHIMWESLLVHKYVYSSEDYYDGIIDLVADDKYVVAGNKVFDIKRNLIWKCEEGFFIKVSPDGQFGIIIVPMSIDIDPISNECKKLLCIDLFNKRVKWEENLENSGFSALDLCSDGENAISNKYLIINNRGRGLTYLYEIISKKIIYVWVLPGIYKYEFNDEENIAFWNNEGMWCYNLVESELEQMIRWPSIKLDKKLVSKDDKSIIGVGNKMLYFYDISGSGNQ